MRRGGGKGGERGGMEDKQGEKRGAARVIRRLLLRRCDRLLRREVACDASNWAVPRVICRREKRLIIPNKAPLGGAASGRSAGPPSTSSALKCQNPRLKARAFPISGSAGGEV